MGEKRAGMTAAGAFCSRMTPLIVHKLDAYAQRNPQGKVLK
jgi:hypothetical protein